jgi:hypothetical protein
MSIELIRTREPREGGKQSKERGRERRELLAGLVEEDSTLMDAVPEDVEEEGSGVPEPGDGGDESKGGMELKSVWGVGVRVIKTCRNPRLVLCEVISGEAMRGERILVDVRKNVLFRPRMEFEAERAKNGERFEWCYYGKMPRFRGHW